MATSLKDVDVNQNAKLSHKGGHSLKDVDVNQNVELNAIGGHTRILDSSLEKWESDHFSSGRVNHVSSENAVKSPANLSLSKKGGTLQTKRVVEDNYTLIKGENVEKSKRVTCLPVDLVSNDKTLKHDSNKKWKCPVLANT